MDEQEAKPKLVIYILLGMELISLYLLCTIYLGHG
jgi:hypothetical protein